MNVFQKFLTTQYHCALIQMDTTTVQIKIPFITVNVHMYVLCYIMLLHFHTALHLQ